MKKTITYYFGEVVYPPSPLFPNGDVWRLAEGDVLTPCRHCRSYSTAEEIHEVIRRFYPNAAKFLVVTESSVEVEVEEACHEQA